MATAEWLLINCLLRVYSAINLSITLRKWVRVWRILNTILGYYATTFITMMETKRSITAYQWQASWTFVVHLQFGLVEGIKIRWLRLGKHWGLASNKVPCITTSERTYFMYVTLCMWHDFAWLPPLLLYKLCHQINVEQRVVISYFHSRPMVVFWWRWPVRGTFDWSAMKPSKCNLKCFNRMSFKS